MGQIAIAWLLARPGVATVLLGARTAAQLDQNLGAAHIELTPEDIGRLTDVSAPSLPPYPYGMVSEWCGVDVWHRLGTIGDE